MIKVVCRTVGVRLPVRKSRSMASLRVCADPEGALLILRTTSSKDKGCHKIRRSMRIKIDLYWPSSAKIPAGCSK